MHIVNSQLEERVSFLFELDLLNFCEVLVNEANIAFRTHFQTFLHNTSWARKFGTKADFQKPHCSKNQCFSLKNQTRNPTYDWK